MKLDKPYRNGGRMDWDDRIRWVAERYEDGSRRALGRKIGLSGQAVSAWVRGDSVPSGEALAAISFAYPELRPRWLLTGQGRPTVPTGDGRPDGGNGRKSCDGASVPDDVIRRPASAYERGRRDAVLEMRQMLGRYSGAPFPDGDRELPG